MGYTKQKMLARQWLWERRKRLDWTPFTAGELAREKNMTVTTARKHLLDMAQRPSEMLVTWQEEYRSNTHVNLFVLTGE